MPDLRAGRGTRRRSRAEEYDELLRRACVATGSLALGPPLVLAAMLIPLAIVVGLQFGFILFVLVFASRGCS